MFRFTVSRQGKSVSFHGNPYPFYSRKKSVSFHGTQTGQIFLAALTDLKHPCSMSVIAIRRNPISKSPPAPQPAAMSASMLASFLAGKQFCGRAFGQSVGSAGGLNMWRVGGSLFRPVARPVGKALARHVGQSLWRRAVFAVSCPAGRAAGWFRCRSALLQAGVPETCGVSLVSVRGAGRLRYRMPGCLGVNAARKAAGRVSGWHA